MAAAYHPPGGSLEFFVASDVDGQRGTGVVVGFFKAQAVDDWRWQGPFEPPGQEHVPVPVEAHVAAPIAVAFHPPGGSLEAFVVERLHPDDDAGAVVGPRTPILSRSPPGSPATAYSLCQWLVPMVTSHPSPSSGPT
jgi:hypothetical protein